MAVTLPDQVLEYYMIHELLDKIETVTERITIRMPGEKGTHVHEWRLDNGTWCLVDYRWDK